MEDDERTEDEAAQRATLGEFIASQRRAAEMSLRQLAERAGISNPYVSQIERGLRKPSAEVLQSLATALSVSAETLFQRAGLLDPGQERSTSVPGAIRNDGRLSEAQKQALLEIYTAFISGSGQRDGTQG
ncbi:helix-turn-helix domain-containing protein [Nigerium massiliense]|uniref:helix-turn-helix domain-containing protein n=1 Tax=Nigerium massiliense TaxID=1522317 RepID=UPI00069365F5|nr:helix-turn-helix transcriptional regulator [Nigerium massiliense]